MSQFPKNRLAKASSPYLRQHANNPVDWYEWGEEALEKAKREDKPLLISIGYSACHWCHVMAHESFMDEQVAEMMNAYFVPIKVDREERPDIDQIYIEAAQLLNGNAGWPLNAFALPDGRPFWVGTYFPKSNWVNVLQQLHKVYTEKREVIDEQAQALVKGIQQEPLYDIQLKNAENHNKTEYTDLFKQAVSKIDFKHGGFESPQKFPMVSGWEFLLQYAALTENEQAKKAVELTLKAMAQGGIYDQLGGGFARYATDEKWFAPHFEKMLYDNAQLVSFYARAYRFSKNEHYQKIVEETLEFVNRELTHEKGGFFSALDADSEGQEGAFYVWKARELERILTEEEYRLITAYYGITRMGNWEEGHNILHITQDAEELADKMRMSSNRFRETLNQAKNKLFEVRSQRIRPATDDKILLSWNALMLKAYVEAYRSFGKREYLECALKNAEFIETNMRLPDGGLYRNFRKKASIPGFLDDYAFLADAYIALYQVTFEKEWLDKAKQLVDYAFGHFYDTENRFFFYTSSKSERLVARKSYFMDNEIPSSNSVLAGVLLDLESYFEADKYVETAQDMLAKVKPLITQQPTYFGKWAQLLGQVVHGTTEVAVMGKEARQKAAELQSHFWPTTLFLGGDKEDLALLEGKKKEGKTFIYVCRNKTCKQPVQEVKQAIDQLRLRE